MWQDIIHKNRALKTIKQLAIIFKGKKRQIGSLEKPLCA